MGWMHISIEDVEQNNIRFAIIVSCKMYFVTYPFDVNHCLFQVGSYYGTNDTMKCTSEYRHSLKEINVPP